MSKPNFTVGMARAFGRRPTREPVPFQQILPLSLKNSVSGKGERSSDVACLQEMAVFFACLNTHEFNQALCAKEISAFQSCYKNHLEQKAKAKQEEDSLVSSTGSHKLHFKKLNKILARFPNPS